MKNLVKNLGIIVLLFVLFAGALYFVNNDTKKPENVSLNKIAEFINADTVSSITLDGDTVDAKLKDGSEKISQKEPESSFSEQIKSYNVSDATLAKINVTVKQTSGFSYFVGAWLPILLPLVVIGVFFWIVLRQAQNGNKKALSFGQSNANVVETTKATRVTFKDVAGAKEAKIELAEVVEFLRDPKKFSALGAKIPKGVLLLGSPGTGKTLLARAVAGEAGVPFLNISGSEFVEMFVGVGASRVRDLFKKAKRNAPCIIFIDEIDAVGRQRGSGLGGSHDEREQTLNQILIEMDGFETNASVIVIAATNRPDVLDPALLRPGRFDRRVMIDLPDIKDREEILAVHARNKPLAADVNLNRLAQRTPGFSGADLANLLNEAAITAARFGRKEILMEDCVNSIEKVMMGPERRSRVLSDKEKQIIAYHEAGHALVGHLLPNSDPIHKISIVSRGSAGGYTLKLPSEDKHLHNRAEFEDDIAMMMGGYAAEKLVFGDVTTGPSNDLQKASELARQLVMRFGMSDALGPITVGSKDEMIFLGREIHEQRNYSESTAAKIDAEVGRIINIGHAKAVDLVTTQRAKLDEIARILIDRETIEQDEFKLLMEGKWPTADTAPKTNTAPTPTEPPKAQ